MFPGGIPASQKYYFLSFLYDEGNKVGTNA